jgi:hypothetical protein
MFDNTTRTAIGAFLQTHQLLGLLPYEVVPYTTLNEKLGIASNLTLGPNEMPSARYTCIGNGGHGVKSGATLPGVPVPLQHSPEDFALFNMLPFVLRPIGDDLNSTQRARFGLRRIEEHSGSYYYAYYLRRLDLTNMQVKLLLKSVTGGVTNITPYVPTSSNLNPTPPDLTNTGTNVPTGDSLAANAKLPVIYDETDIAEIVNAVKVIYGDEDLSIISELGLVSGVDRVIMTESTGSTSINFNEVLAAQIHSHIAGIQLLRFANKAITSNYNVGATEPLFL